MFLLTECKVYRTFFKKNSTFIQGSVKWCSKESVNALNFLCN